MLTSIPGTFFLHGGFVRICLSRSSVSGYPLLILLELSFQFLSLFDSSKFYSDSQKCCKNSSPVAQRSPSKKYTFAS